MIGRMKRHSIGLLCVTAVLLFGVMLSRGGFLPNVADMQQSRHVFIAYVGAHPFLAAFFFVCFYILTTALSLPIATLLTLLGGFLFGIVWGTILVVISATLGAGIIFILARYFFRDFFVEKARILRGGEDAPSSFGTFTDVLIARLVPAVPFSFINIVAGVTSISFRDYILATILGIAPFTAVYVFAGTKLSDLHSTADIFSSSTLKDITLIMTTFGVLYVCARIYAHVKNIT